MKQLARKVASILAVWLVGAAMFFRPVWTSRFDVLSGDLADTRLIMYLHEHWLQVLAGDAAWRAPSFYYPAPGVLGYSDTFVLNMIIYGPLRALGCDQFLAMQITLILLTLIGFIGCYLVLRRLLALPAWMALALSWAFAFANNISVQLVHPQLLAVYWLPWIVLLAARAWTAATRRHSLGWAFGAGSLLGVVTYSTYYVGWFAMFIAAIVGIAYLAQRPRATLLAARRTVALWSSAAAGFAVWLIPFAVTYLPTLSENGGRTRSEVYFHLADVSDLVNYGPTNIWSWLSRAVRSDPLPTSLQERATALTPILVATLVGCAVALFRRARGDRRPTTAVARALVVTSLVITILPVRVAGHSLWDAVWFAVPGARAIRAAGRIALVNGFIAVMAIAATRLALDPLPPDPARRRKWASLVLPALVMLIALEQTNTRPVSTIHRSRELKRLADVPVPPNDCQSFVILPATREFWVFRDVDAMLISHEVGLPTLNGYSGGHPADWDLPTSSEEYLEQAQAWADVHQLEGVCGYEPAAAAWTVDPFG